MLKRCLVLLLGLALASPAMAAGYGRHHYGGHFHYYHHRGGDAGGALIAGLIFGGLAGYLISEDRHYWDEPVYSYDYPAYYPYEPYHRYVVVEPPPGRVVVQEPVEPQFAGEFAGQNCQMTREYTATIEVDGKKRDAYGTKCLSPDGSWILGRPKLVPKFDN